MKLSRVSILSLCGALFSLSAPVFANLQTQLNNVAAAEREAKQEQAKQHAEQQKCAYADRLQYAQRQKRNQEYQNELNKLALLDKQLELEAKQARIQRTNEYITADLAARKAATDAIQAEADSRRAVSAGIQTHLEKTGEAALKKAH